jgi:geranylgeranyl diphosphate synthase, type II
MYSVHDLQEKINVEIQLRLASLKERKPVELYQPVEYALNIGGKRLRPVMLLLSYNLFSNEIENALPAAFAIEAFHNFTLLHDDIMDKAEVRRNKATVHRRFSENGAILSGDAMAFLSYQYLLECKSERLNDVIGLFTKTAIEVCEGQQYDMDFENRLDVTEEEYLEMIRLKTAVLLGCSLKAGALLANQTNELAEQIYQYGLNLGWAFQLQDDLLDTFGNQETFGKKIGGDILANKKTYLLIKALELSNGDQLSELKKWINTEPVKDEEKIASVTSIYNQVGIRQLTEEKINFYFEQSTKILQNINLTEIQKQQLKLLSKKILKRDR